MAEITYTYSIATDTLNGKVDGVKLQSEIHSTSTITISLNRIDTSGDVLNIVFNDLLHEDSFDNEVTILTGLVNAHDGIPATPGPDIIRVQESQDKFKNLFIKGYRFEAEVDTTTDFDVAIDDLVLNNNIELQNGFAAFKDFSEGDFISFFIVHPQAGVIGQFADHVYIPPDGKVEPGQGFDTSSLPAGISIRLSYTSVATSKPNPIIYLNLRYFR